MAQCRSCDAPILWAKTTAGKMIPIDADPSAGWDQPLLGDDGNLVPTGESVPGKFGSLPVVAHVAGSGERETGSRAWRSHYATCPDAGDWRRR